MLYTGNPANQFVRINYSNYVPASASKACFIIWTSVGGSTGVFWVKLDSAKDFHLTGNIGRGNNLYTDNIE